MATLKVVMTGEEHLSTLDDDWASCKGDRHDFPKLRVGPLPPGVTSRPAKNGVSQLTYTCPDCGTVRTRTTLRGGIIDRSVKYNYKHPAGYIAPPGAGLTKADYANELARRVAPYIRAAGRNQDTA